MASRALIIAIENYPAAEGIEQTLEGTIDTGLKFRDWLLEKWKDLPDSEKQVVFCSSPKQPFGTGATQQELFAALQQLKQDGRGTTNEFYVFFSGHGFAFVNGKERADVIITSDFVNKDVSGHCCLKLDEIVSWLRQMGPGCHIYFIDACRNKMDANDVAPGSLMPPDRQPIAESESFLLHSTVPGATALVQGAFRRLLMDGLRGQGRAKTWEVGTNDAMFVRFDSLRTFLTSALKDQQPIWSGRQGGSYGEDQVILARLAPPPASRCKIEIVGATTADEGTVTVRRGRSSVGAAHPFKQTPDVLEGRETLGRHGHAGAADSTP